MSGAIHPRFIVGPCGRGWWWVIDTERLTCSSPRPTRADAEQRCAEITEQWEKAMRSQVSIQ